MIHVRIIGLLGVCIALVGCVEPGHEESDTDPEPPRASGELGVSQGALRTRADWMRVDAPADSSIALDAWVPRLAYLFSREGWFHSRSLGERWHPIPQPTSGALGYASFMVDPNRPAGALVQGVHGDGQDRELFATRDAGRSWRSLSRTADIRLLAIAPGNGDVLWATPPGTRLLYRSSDRGTTWTVFDFGGPGSCCADFVALSERDVLALGNIAQLQRSFDGGETWPINTFADLYLE